MPKSHRSSSPRVRWTSAQAGAVLAEQQASGLSLLAFARDNGLSAKRLYWWRRRLEAGSNANVPRPAFVEVTTGARELVEIIVRTGRVLRVPASVDPDSLVRLVEALERRSPC